MAKSENLTIMFTDIAGFSELVAAMSRKENEEMMKRHDVILTRMLRIYNGKHIKSIGDSFLIVFRSPTDAVLCAMAMHDALWEISQDLDEKERIIIRIALNLGEVRLTRNDIYGEAVNIAARLESVTPPGDVYLTEAVYLSMNKAEVGAEEVGREKFKGCPEAIRFYKVPRGIKRATVPIKTNDDDEMFQYPFGGMHLDRTDALQQISTAVGKASDSFEIKKKQLFSRLKEMLGDRSASTLESRKTFMFVGALALVMLTGVAAYQIDGGANGSSTDGQEQAQAVLLGKNEAVKNDVSLPAEERKSLDVLVQNKNTKELKKKLKVFSAQYPNAQYLELYRGHLSFLEEKYSEALGLYEAAINVDQSLKEDDIFSANIVGMLDSKKRKEVKLLISKNQSKNIIDDLSERTAAKGLRGRYDAVALLQGFKQSSKIDRISLNVLDFQELNECESKKKAFENLKEIKGERVDAEVKKIQDYFKSPDGKKVYKKCRFNNAGVVEASSMKQTRQSATSSEEIIVEIKE
jgi:class 3 adenylate cyclase